jgi:hemerythrin-like domain-containing protein
MKYEVARGLLIHLPEEVGMNALTLLKDDHDDMKKLLSQADDTTERAVKTRNALLREIAVKLTAHEKIEEEIFYPALKDHPKARDIVLEGYQEHHVVDLIMGELQNLDESDETWGAKFSVMKENIEHHIEEEEGEMFTKARAAFSAEELTELGDRMQEMKEAILTSSLTSR